MEEEEKAAQSAKLQELIRRGSPEDLQEANRLMKVMAGFDTRHKTDYRAKAAEEVAKVQQKAKLLEEMLQTLQPDDKLADGDVFEVRESKLVVLFYSKWTTPKPTYTFTAGTSQCPPECTPQNIQDV